MIYIRPSSKQYEYARRVATGAEPWRVEREMGIPANTARTWRYRLRKAVEQATGTRYPYAIAAILALVPSPERKQLLTVLTTHGIHDTPVQSPESVASP